MRASPFRSHAHDELHSRQQQQQQQQSAPLTPSQQATQKYAQRESERRIESQAHTRFQRAYSREEERTGGVNQEEEEEDEYRYFSGRSLPIKPLNRNQQRTAHDISIERRRENLDEERKGDGGQEENEEEAAVRSEAELLDTIDYLEKFLIRAKQDLAQQQDSSRMDTRGRERSNARRSTYTAPTVTAEAYSTRSTAGASSSSSTLPRPPIVYNAKHNQDMHRIEQELDSLKRQLLQPTSRSEANLTRTLQNIQQRKDLERNLEILSQHRAIDRDIRPQSASSPQTAGQQTRSLVRSASSSHAAGTFHPSTTAATSSPLRTRVPSHHPHRTGIAHDPSRCIYCQREHDWNVWDIEAQKKEREMRESRLTPLAKSMRDTTAASPLSPADPITRDFSNHYLAQLSASHRRSTSHHFSSLRHLLSSCDHTRYAQRRRIEREIQEEARRHAAHLKMVELQAIERTLKRTMMDKQHEREVEKLIADSARESSRLLRLKRESLSNFTRDQSDLVMERYRLEKEDEKLRRQNEKYERRLEEKEAREMEEEIKRRKFQAIKQQEEKFDLQLQQLRRPANARNGIEDLAFWPVGRG